MLRSGDPLDIHWRTLNDHGGRQAFHHAQLERGFNAPVAASNGRLRKLFSPVPMFPFKIYTLSAWLKDAPDPTTWWRTFRVRAGKLAVADVAGTDGAAWPDSETMPAYNAAYDVVVPDDASFIFVWITGGGSPSINFSSKDKEVPVAGWTASSGWNDGIHYLVGWVDTHTDHATKVAHVRQIIRTDVTPSASTGGGQYEHWVATKVYPAGSIVRLGTGDNAGVYGTIQDVPKGVAPTIVGNPYWELIALPVQATTICFGDSEGVIYLNASQAPSP